jgi:hypothetical protein
MVDVFQLAENVVLHAMSKGLTQSYRLSRLYTPFARGVNRQCTVVPAEEFMCTSTTAMEYNNFLTHCDLSGLKHWIRLLQLLNAKNLLFSNLSYEELKSICYAQNLFDFKTWTLPTFQLSDGDRIICRMVNFNEYAMLHDLPVRLVFQHIVHITLFGFPILPSFCDKLRLQKVLHLYIRARLFQGVYDLLNNADGDPRYVSMFGSKSQFGSHSVDQLMTTTSLTDLQSMLMNTEWIGAGSEIVYAMARSKRFQQLGCLPLDEYMLYVEKCPEHSAVPAGFKVYNNIIHPIISAPHQQAFINYSF